MERMRAEADATAKEKAAARAEKASRPGPRKAVKSAAPRGRVRFVWCVCGPNGKEVKQFPYPQEPEAQAAAKELTESTGKTHFVQKGEVPFE